MIVELLCITIPLGLLYLYLKIKRAQSHWKNVGAPHRPTNFLFGDLKNNLLKKKTFAEAVEDIYHSIPDTRYTGFYSFLLPVLLLRDPELIKQLTVKDFDHFVDHRPFLPDDVDPIWSKNLFALKAVPAPVTAESNLWPLRNYKNDGGEHLKCFKHCNKWRFMRTTLSPAFTSSKMKQLFSLINDIGINFVKYFKENVQEGECVEVKDVLSRFTNDVIASSAFGIEVDSLVNRNNDFYVLGKDLVSFDKFTKNIKFVSYIVIPGIAKALGVQIFNPKIGKFFSNIIKETIKKREENNIKRPDMINILMEAKKGKLRFEEESCQGNSFSAIEESSVNKNDSIRAPITDEDIAAQAIIFFLAGFDTVSTCMSFMAYELAVNQDVQEKLQREVDEAFAEGQGILTYEIVQKMKYLDMVVSEALRKWPPTTVIDRVCTKPYTIEPKLPGEKPIFLDKGSYFWMPMNALHRDPKFFPDPEKFDPERFSEENKHKIVPYSYIPFGSGPRACIGSRFALLEVKTLFFNLLANFKILTTEKTQIPVKLKKTGFNVTSENGIWLKFEPRN